LLRPVNRTMVYTYFEIGRIIVEEEQIFEIIKNQLKDNDPPETKETFVRLKKQGFDDFQTKKTIGQCLAIELFDVMKHGKPYNNERYVKNLLALPKEPIE